MNGPRLGQPIKVEPIKRKSDLEAIRTLLKDNRRDLALFNLGVNTALRASDLLALRVGPLQHLGPGESFRIREKKTGKERLITLNNLCFHSLRAYLDERTPTPDDAPLFLSRKGRTLGLQVSTLHNMVKDWCARVYLRGNYGSHSLRKTFGYHQRVHHGLGTAELMTIFNHRTERQTLDYLCIQAEEVRRILMTEI